MRNGNGKQSTQTAKTVQCAIYTRKSTDEGLNQDFNSLDAQRDAAEAFILSQRSEGSGKSPRYYQEIAINRAVQAVLQEKRRVLLTLATGTGKTIVAFQICWKLWNSRWNRTGEYRRPRILYLADRNVLVDDPKDKIFTPFGDARWKIEGEASSPTSDHWRAQMATAKM